MNSVSTSNIPIHICMYSIIYFTVAKLSSQWHDTILWCLHVIMEQHTVFVNKHCLTMQYRGIWVWDVPCIQILLFRYIDNNRSCRQSSAIWSCMTYRSCRRCQTGINCPWPHDQHIGHMNKLSDLLCTVPNLNPSGHLLPKYSQFVLKILSHPVTEVTKFL